MSISYLISPIYKNANKLCLASSDIASLSIIIEEQQGFMKGISTATNFFFTNAIDLNFSESL